MTLRLSSWMLPGLLILSSLSTPASAWERGWGWGGAGFIAGAMVGAQLASPYRYYGYGYPYYAAPVVYNAAPVVVQAPQPAYVPQSPPPRQAAPMMQASDNNSWYYCSSAKGYYPYVKQCPEPWQRVPASPAPPADPNQPPGR